jgi:sporulation protein YlmC with PRC-barrel domain
MMRISKLCGKTVRRQNGEILGRIREVHAEDNQITTLICGARGILQRFTGSRKGHRVAWKDVIKLDGDEIIVADNKSSR